LGLILLLKTLFLKDFRASALPKCLSLPAYAAAQGMDVGTIGQILHVHAAKDKIKLQIEAWLLMIQCLSLLFNKP